MQENPDELSAIADEISPLRGLIVETHEVYQELMSVGFPSVVAAQIVANMLAVAMAVRSDEDEDEDDEVEI